ncbi:tRNA (N(6)-L-threonylcarbamoyladenosine(37)-C(2))-methylthiotransferase MtaB [Caminibacter mediatlanticus TB-2]|uniref:MiaB-like tRNA modifying enzyme n=1 Tax=Caminibacter mediatlanticus TB-2 TaxID=391592 RepID=A0AAI9AIL5_9BACT|nr:tRNA (N(6)-L-threonylcarbamoyladenosine(37)-C(2))-methylthiotransferase MtaB [Caminibacter mediatlanticus]EDM24210.1 MiaB-like tRNA modifying enzyme [Caminibacter mediatlanticus TB-2]QCT94858.1 tRNA (N(6)-L-threonylcarbamoyladenosine(37)-C(2))-methylthiotransferase MtaB [Caminibacter mediatlanticus TB-2]
MKVFFKTFGCRSNIFDTEIMKNILKEKVDIVKNENDADIIIVNSCTVTNFADRDIRSYVNKFSNKKIIFTGCGAYTQGEKLFKESKVFNVLGHKFKEEIDKFLDFKGINLGDFDFVNKKIVESFDKTKAFIKIQEGCDFECAYCIIPKVRGSSRSIEESLILEEIKKLRDNGISEFVLTGINMGSYGKDTNTSLSKLIEKISNIRGVKRIRLGSLEPSQIDDRLIELTQNGILEKHLHIALQHTSDKMLRIMKRRNRVSSTLPLFERLASMNIALGTDFIVGHPGESEEIFNEALSNFKKYPLTHIHLFRYSPREGTLSATMKQDVKGDVSKKRAKILEEIVKKNNYEFRKKQGEVFVHIEDKKDGYSIGYDEFYNKMKIKGDFYKGEWMRIKDYEVKEEVNVKE